MFARNGRIEEHAAAGPARTTLERPAETRACPLWRTARRAAPQRARAAV